MSNRAMLTGVGLLILIGLVFVGLRVGGPIMFAAITAVLIAIALSLFQMRRAFRQRTAPLGPGNLHSGPSDPYSLPAKDGRAIPYSTDEELLRQIEEARDVNRQLVEEARLESDLLAQEGWRERDERRERKTAKERELETLMLEEQVAVEREMEENGQ